MASIKLKHTSGNGTILNSPAANPSSDITLKLPSTTGSAGQVLQVASANHSATNAELEFVAAGGGKVVQFKYAQTAALVETTSTSMQDWDALNVAITPTSSSNLLYANLVVKLASFCLWKLKLLHIQTNFTPSLDKPMIFAYSASVNINSGCIM